MKKNSSLGSNLVCAVLLYPNRHIIDIFEALKEHGVEVHYYFFAGIPDYRENNNWEIPEHAWFLSPLRPNNYFGLLLKSRKCKAVFFQSMITPFFYNAALQFLVQKLRGNRFIASEGSRSPNKPRKVAKIFAKLFLNNSHVQHLSIGTGAASDYLRYGLTNWRYRKFCFCEHYNDVDGPVWQAVPDENIVILCVGRLLKRKNFTQVLNSLSHISTSRKLTIVICGTGPEEKPLKELAAKVPPNVNVHFAGHCGKEALDTYYRRADIFVLPSTYEGWGVVVNHALHFGLPLLLSKNVRSGTNYLLKENENGLTFDTTESLAKSLELLINDDALREKMAIRSQQHNQFWSMGIIASRLAELIENPDAQFEDGPLSEIRFDSVEQNL